MCSPLREVLIASNVTTLAKTTVSTKSWALRFSLRESRPQVLRENNIPCITAFARLGVARGVDVSKLIWKQDKGKKGAYLRRGGPPPGPAIVE